MSILVVPLRISRSRFFFFFSSPFIANEIHRYLVVPLELSSFRSLSMKRSSIFDFGISQEQGVVTLLRFENSEREREGKNDSSFFPSPPIFASDIRRVRGEIGGENAAIFSPPFFPLCHFSSPKFSRHPFLVPFQRDAHQAAELNKIYLVGRGSRGIPAHTGGQT